MSFILDALKKSEAERQRNHGPALAEVTYGPRRGSQPWWIIGLGTGFEAHGDQRIANTLRYGAREHVRQDRIAVLVRLG